MCVCERKRFFFFFYTNSTASELKFNWWLLKMLSFSDKVFMRCYKMLTFISCLKIVNKAIFYYFFLLFLAHIHTKEKWHSFLFDSIILLSLNLYLQQSFLQTLRKHLRAHLSHNFSVIIVLRKDDKVHIKLIIDPKLSIEHMALSEVFPLLRRNNKFRRRNCVETKNQNTMTQHVSWNSITCSWSEIHLVYEKSILQIFRMILLSKDKLSSNLSIVKYTNPKQQIQYWSICVFFSTTKMTASLMKNGSSFEIMMGSKINYWKIKIKEMLSFP